MDHVLFPIRNSRRLRVKEEHRSKIAFRTSSGQLFEFNWLPFGLRNAPATFSKLMDNMLSGLSWEVCLYYLDDIIVVLKGCQEYLERLRMVFTRLRVANLRLGSPQMRLGQEFSDLFRTSDVRGRVTTIS